MSANVCNRCVSARVDVALAEAEVQRLARMMARSEAAQIRHAPKLAAAKAERDDARALRDAHAAECEDGRDEVGHGTRSRYNAHGCRCDECRASNTAYTSSRRATR